MENKPGESRNAEDRYKETSKRFSLPNYAELSRIIMLDDIGEDSNFLREIGRKIAEKLDSYGRMLEMVIQPEQSLQMLHETSAFEASEKMYILTNYKKVMRILRDWQLIDLEYDDPTAADFINKFYKEWTLMLPMLKGTLRKIRDSWDLDFSDRINLEYFG